MGILGRFAHTVAPGIYGRWSGYAASTSKAPDTSIATIPPRAVSYGAPVAPESARFNDFARAMEQAQWLMLSVSILASKAAALPIIVSKARAGGEREDLAPDHPLLGLLLNPNPVHSGMLFWQTVFSHIMLAGVSFLQVTPTRGQMPGELWPLQPDCMWIYPSRDLWIDHYEYRIGSCVQRYATEEIICLRTAHPVSPYFGLAPVKPLEGTIALELLARTWNMAKFQNHSAVEGMWSTDDPMLSPDQAREIERHIEEKLKGAGNAGKSLVTWGGLKFTPTSQTARDMEYSQLAANVRDIETGVLGIPPIMAGRTDNASYDNATTQIRMFYQNGVKSLTDVRDSAVNLALAPKPPGWPRSIISRPFGGLVIATDYSKIPELQDDQQKLEAVRDMKLRNNSATINEVRAERGEGPVSWGDVAWGPMSQVPIGSMDLGIDSQDTGTQPAAETDAPSADDQAPKAARVSKAFRGRMDETQRKLHWFVWDATVRRQQKTISRAFARLFAELAGVVDLEDEGQPFPIAAWRKRMVSTGIPIITGIVEQGAQAGLERAEELAGKSVRAGKAFDVSPRLMVEFLRERENKLSDVADTAFNELNASLAQGREAGENVDSLRKRVEAILGQTEVEDAVGVGLRVGWRAERIARTETVPANNQGSLFGYEQSGVVGAKEWIATQDERAREEHRVMDAIAVGLHDPFIVDGEELQFPGDPAGSAGNVINCRCTVGPVVE